MDLNRTALLAVALGMTACAGLSHESDGSLVQASQERVVSDHTTESESAGRLAEPEPIQLTIDEARPMRSADPASQDSVAGGSERRAKSGYRPAYPSSYPMVAPPPPFHTEAYDHIAENGFHMASDDPLSTFSIDVDTASYANVRRFLMQQHQRPPKDAVRIEELINYFHYDYEHPSEGRPLAVHVDATAAPWDTKRRLVRVGVQAKRIENRDRRPANLVFLIDVSGSMQSPNKLPLLKRGMRMLVEQLDTRDRIAIVVYAGASGLVLPSTKASESARIADALEGLRAGGSTNGAAGIELAYEVATKNFVPGGTNRVILATDGDFNVGTTSRGELVRLIEQKRKSNVFLSVLGFGGGNYKDATLEELSRHGNGNYAYVDSLHEARKVLVEEMGSTLVTVAKDVKIQVEFNPARVQAYRLLGYENRMLEARDFNDDRKDAGEVGAGHSVTALYEVVLPGQPLDVPSIDPLKYSRAPGEAPDSDEMLTVKVRYKEPTGERSRKIELPFRDSGADTASDDLRFAAAVAGFGMLLRESEFRADLTYEQVATLARQSLGSDRGAYRAEFLRLLEVARAMK